MSGAAAGFPDGARTPMRAVVAASRDRAASVLGEPAAARPTVAIAEDELRDRRQAHPLAPLQPLIDELIVDPARDGDLIVALADEAGRLVWVDGDRAVRERAAGMGFVPGADWSEAKVGTSAPGTALAVGAPVRVTGEEHWSPAAHPFSCTAVPVRDPAGRVLGALDVTGGEEAAAPHTLALLRAAGAALEAELRAQAAAGGAAARAAQASTSIRLRLLGTATGSIEAHDGRRIELSPRHSEILLILAWHPDGLSAAELSALLYPDGGDPMTLRAELVRLRRVLAGIDPSLALSSRPYRIDARVATDAGDVLRAVGRGAHRQALEEYRGPVLPGSVAPGVVEIREVAESTLRDAAVARGSGETLLRWLELPGHEHDVEAAMAALRLLPPRSPKRSELVARLEQLGC